MNYLYSNDPIIACSTGTHTNAAMAVIRISGFKKISDFDPFFIKNLHGPIEPRKVYYTKLVLQGQLIDDLCLTYFEAPFSYTGENVLELSIHGNLLNIERILNMFVQHAGCRLSERGEFTFRALKNKKLSLSQVEGLDLFLNAKSGYALDQGLSLLSGNLNQFYQELYNLFLVHKSSLELSIDFSEDIGDEAAKDYFHTSLKNFSDKFQSLVKRVRPMDFNLISPEIVIAGLPNSGKSSLFNFLLSDDRAIVSKIAGTTRDFLSETLSIEGVNYKLIDTAGVRESDDLIEAEGIKRTLLKLENSFFSILLINPFEMSDEFDDLIKNHFDLIIFTHSDLPDFSMVRQNLEEKYPFLGPMGAISINSLDHFWEDNLKGLINKKYLYTVKDQPILLERHKQLILQISDLIKQYQVLADTEDDVAILSHELNLVGHCLSELLGIISPEQVLNSIFSNFCIGK